MSSDLSFFLRRCADKGLLAAVQNQQWDRASGYKLAQWRGDAVLGLGVKRLVAETYPDMAVSEMALVAGLSVQNQTLARFFELHRLAEFGVKALAGAKGKADCVEALLWELQLGCDANDSDARNAQWHCWDELIKIGKQRILERQALPQGDSAESLAWLSQWACESREEAYTHSSLRGTRDHSTSTGRLCIPDEPAVQEQLRFHILQRFHAGNPLCGVEMTTTNYPFFEDIDIMGSDAQDAGPPDDILLHSSAFWQLRAEILHELFPTVDTLELTLFKASGWNCEKGCYKASFHAVWPQLVVTRERAHLVRLATLTEFGKRSYSPGELNRLRWRLLEIDDRNDWPSVFDIASVRGGSFRLPFNDKLNKQANRREDRPILPESVWCFHFTELGRVHWYAKTHDPPDLPELDWLKRGSVRLPPDASLTPWRPFRIGCWLSSQQPAVGGGESCGSSCDRRSRAQEKARKEIVSWQHEQVRRRRVWHGTADEFKTRIDTHLGDPAGNESTLLAIKAKTGKSRFLWASRRLRGAIEIQEPDGEVFIRGNQEMQLYLIELISQFTDPWTGELPRVPSKVQARFDPGHSKTKRPWTEKKTWNNNFSFRPSWETTWSGWNASGASSSSDADSRWHESQGWWGGASPSQFDGEDPWKRYRGLTSSWSESDDLWKHWRGLS
eukprot:TRINITY_DN57948_c0_g1_i1.p1 TRINITY_DN57948_c0_g1~~TRINITY_DN57948_c0_g1_i1.p1  ORF type:complete len:671 (+),score=76.33 TRINITY_DN57948_c0_g1_i1:63-2075(+)